MFLKQEADQSNRNKDFNPKLTEVLINKPGSRNVPQTEKVYFQSVAERKVCQTEG